MKNHTKIFQFITFRGTYIYSKSLRITFNKMIHLLEFMTELYI